MIAQADAQGELIQKCQKAKILLPDLRWPHLQWNHQTQAFDVAEKEPVSTPKLTSLVQALIDHAMVLARASLNAMKEGFKEWGKRR